MHKKPIQETRVHSKQYWLIFIFNQHWKLISYPQNSWPTPLASNGLSFEILPFLKWISQNYDALQNKDRKKMRKTKKEKKETKEREKERKLCQIVAFVHHQNKKAKLLLS